MKIGLLFIQFYINFMHNYINIEYILSFTTVVLLS